MTATGVTTYVTATINACAGQARHAPHLRMSMVWPDSADRRPHPLWCLGYFDQERQNRRVVIADTDGVVTLAGEGLTVVGSAYREQREPGACGECREPEDFAWHPHLLVEQAPVITCHTHGALAPGWAYDVEVGVQAWRNDAYQGLPGNVPVSLPDTPTP